jgi:hypothetical protein
VGINYIPLESQFGFKSPGFTVDNQGNIVARGITLVSDDPDDGSIITVDNVIIKGVQLLEGGNSDTLSFGDNITHSFLTKLGTLQYLDIDGDLTISQGSTAYFRISDGVVTMNSVASEGAIDNVAIGLEQPAAANFTSVNIGPGDSTGELSVQGNVIVTTNVTSPLITSDTTIVNDAPTSASHATRKDYVDRRVTAFSIAFGA